MFDYGFANYRLYPVAEKGTPVKGKLPVNGGDDDGVSLMLDDDLTLLITQGMEQSIELKPTLPEYIDAPVNKGEKVGSVEVVLEGKCVAELGIVTADEVGATGVGYTLKRIIGLWII